MAIERELRLLLEYARLPESNDNNAISTKLSIDGLPSGRIAVSEIYDRLLRIRDQTALPTENVLAGMNLPEILVLTAEAAVYQQDFEVASRCAEWFCSEFAIKNQFFCRMQFVLAHCASHECREDTGALRLRRVLNAIHFILAVPPIAMDPRRRPHYDFLIYNASVTYWQIARQLMKKSTFQYLVPSLTSVIEALKASGEKEALWMIRLQLALVHAQVDAKQFAAAAKIINDVVDTQFPPLLNDTGSPSHTLATSLYEEALRLQVHLGSFKDPECQKIIPNVKKTVPPTNKRATMLVKLQTIKSGVVTSTVEAALIEFYQELVNMPSFSVTETSDEELRIHLQGLDASSSQHMDGEMIVETGILAAFLHEDRLAVCCDLALQAKGKNLSPRLRSLHQILKAVLLFTTQPTNTSNSKLNQQERSALIMTQRVEGVKALERSLLACKRQQDPNLVESVCIYAWNLSLPLLQPQSRWQLARFFPLIASSLEELQSLVLDLRVRVLLEVAKLEVSSDFMAKAQGNVHKAICLDYGVIVGNSTPTIDELTNQEAKYTRRSADVHLLPLKKQLDLKLSSTEPIDEQHAVAAAVEHLKEAKDLAQRQRQLRHAVRAIQTALAQAETDQSLQCDASVHLLLHLNAVSSYAWHELKDVSVGKTMALDAIRLFFSDSTMRSEESVFQDKYIKMLEVDLRLRLVDIVAHEIRTHADSYQRHIDEQASSSPRKLGRRASTRTLSTRGPRDDVESLALASLHPEAHVLGIAIQPGTISGVEDDTTIAVTERREALQLELLHRKKEVLQQLTAALSAATRIGWTFIVENTSIYLWNYHFHIFRMLLSTGNLSSHPVSSILGECVSAFESTLTALEDMVADEINVDLLASVAYGLAFFFEKSSKWDRATAIADGFLKNKGAGSALIGNSVLLHVKRFTEIKIRTQLSQTGKLTPVETTSLLKVISSLEAMEWTLQQSTLPSFSALPPAQQAQTMEKAQGFYQQALSAWQLCASETLDALKNQGSTLEAQQQQLEVYMEIWTRLGCGSFRFQNPKFAIECCEKALFPVNKFLSEREQQLWCVDHTWKWCAIAELVYGRSILALLSGETAAWKLIEGSLNHLERSTQYVQRIGAFTLVRQATEVAWNTLLTGISAVEEEKASGESNLGGSDSLEHCWKRLIPSLRGIITCLQGSDVGGQPQEDGKRLYGDFVLLVLEICEKANAWIIALEDIATFQAVAAATLGKTSMNGAASGGSSGNDSDPIMQAKILKKIAFSSRKNPPAQLRALSNAYKVLEGHPQEQALLLLDAAEWFYTHQFPIQEVEAHLEAAFNILRTKSSPTNGRSTGASSSGARGSQDSRASSVAGSTEVVYSFLWSAEKLIRLFTLRAVAAPTMTQRWEHARNGLVHVQAAWQSIVDLSNESDLQERYQQEYANATTPSVEFDDWRVGKTTKYPAMCPSTVTGWISFYQQYATSLTNRFYMQWTKSLETLAKESRAAYITQPIVTLNVLEQLLDIINAFGYVEWMLPTICLHQVVYYVYCPHKSKAAEIWMELTLYRVLERLNLAVFTVPLQNALEMLQTSGNLILKELQQDDCADDSVATSGTLASSRHRRLLQLSHVSVTHKVSELVNALLALGYVRQGKTLLLMLESVTQRRGRETLAFVQSQVLSSHLFDIEGQETKAVDSANFVLNASLPLPLKTVVDLRLRQSSLTQDKSQAIEVLEQAERSLAAELLRASTCGMLNPEHQGAAKYLTSASTRSDAVVVDLDVITGLAKLKARRAELLLAKGGFEAVAKLLEPVMRVFRESLELLGFVEARRERATLSAIFANRLIEAHHVYCKGTSDDKALLEARSLLITAKVDLEHLRRWAFQPDEVFHTSRSLIPLDLEIADVNLAIAQLELRLEETPAVITEEQMTWYVYERDTRRNIVEKWLDQTAKEEKLARYGSVSKAFLLAGASRATLTCSPKCYESSALARVVSLQCQRVALYHSDDRATKLAVRQWLWTRFTSEQSSHATWMCCRNDEPKEEAERSTLEIEMDATLKELSGQMEQELKAAMDHGHLKVMHVCSYELVQLYGCVNPLECIKSLLLFQALEVREQQMKPLVMQCLTASNASKLHLRRMESLRESTTCPERNSLPFRLSRTYLEQQSDLYKRMQVSVPVDTILASLSPQLRVLSLQFSPDRCFLYAAWIGNADKHYAMARMECTRDKLELLADLQHRVSQWRQSIVKTVLAEDSSQDLSDFVAVEGGVQTEKSIASDELEAQFNQIVTGMHEFFGSLFDHSALASVLQADTQGNTIALLVDRALEFLPLGALTALERADAVTRDFSIHMLHHRLNALKAHTFRREDMRYMADPWHEDIGLTDQTIATMMQQLTKKPGAPLAAWKDAVDHGQVPTTTDWQQALLTRRFGGLCYVGPTRVLGSFVSLSSLAGMNLANACYVLLLLDRAENTTSARRQSKLDGEKAAWELALEEDPYACALLSSLCGVNAIVLNQWTTTFNSTRRLANSLLSGLGRGQSIAKALRRYPDGTVPTLPRSPKRKSSFKGQVGASEKPTYRLKNRVRFNTVMYGLGHMSFGQG
ncbi:hypothetical protein Poli38472_005405 [Pythium oligandrum]|uniref:Uncharacterized protein n=1 Tax=Pythium oligandrum TaxID=41045 RepID=A0A8K1CII8_PYTOL|nr:hypothetical protein Poli38472_005405 [Pythium oligandrum]|eukprot:TMW62787.1 hypothetical protein Poli38472_005405 [Pythium oligandrum]